MSAQKFRKDCYEKRICNTCQQPLPAQKPFGKKGPHRQCDECLEKRRQKQRDSVNSGFCSIGGCLEKPTGGRKACENHRKDASDRRRRYSAQGLCRSCGNPGVNGLKICAKHHKQVTDKIQEIKLGCFLAYGGAFCACCGEHRMEFLQLDHIAGNGKEHRRQLGNAKHGHPFYRYLRRNHYPPGLRVLCANCNLARGFFGYCPHEREQPQPGVLSMIG